jgi:acetyl esterase/lipase
MHALAAYARLVRKPRSYASERSAEAFLARAKSRPQPPTKPSHRTELTQYGGFDCYTVSPPDQTTPQSGCVIYVHGGGYVSEIHSAHWKLIADIATAINGRVLVPIYGLAPDHHASEAAEFVETVIIAAASSGPVYIAGDSSGGGLALAATQTYLAAGNPPLSGLTLISPWLDIALRNPDSDRIAPRDPWLGPEGLRHVGRRWAADLDDKDPRVSPLFGELDALPPIDLYVGTRDVFLPDCRTLRDRLGPARVNFHEEPGAIHVYPLLPVPEGRDARATLVAHIADTLRYGAS